MKANLLSRVGRKWNLDFYNHEMHLFALLGLFTDRNHRFPPPFRILYQVKSLRFHIPEDWKRYPFRGGVFPYRPLEGVLLPPFVHWINRYRIKRLVYKHGLSTRWWFFWWILDNYSSSGLLTQRPLHDYRLRVPNLSFGRATTQDNDVVFLSCTSTVFRIHLQKHLLTFVELNEMEQAR